VIDKYEALRHEDQLGAVISASSSAWTCGCSPVTLGRTGPSRAALDEDALAGHYRASDVLLFTARGSDEGHRAILEAMACGVPPATYPLEGVSSLLGAFSSTHVAPQATPDALAATVQKLLESDLDPIRRAMYERSLEFGYARAARRLIDAYDAALTA